MILKRVSVWIAAAAMCAGLLGGISCTSAANLADETAYPKAENEYDRLFEPDTVIEVNIEIPEDDLQDMYDNAMKEEYHSADITVDGEKVENAGIRIKGNVSLSSVAGSDSDRYSFRIKFDKYESGQKLLGLDELCLNNMFADASYLREYLHYEALRELGSPVPETVFANVSVNGELHGLYLMVEALDGSFLKSYFGENFKQDGNFYKMSEGADLKLQTGSSESAASPAPDSQGGGMMMGPGGRFNQNDGTYSYAELKKGNDTERKGFLNFVEVLNGMPDGEKGEIESVLDVDSALKYIAANTVLGNYDSYNGNMHHNYYLYENADGVFTVVPWDFNMSFAGFGGGDQTQISIDTPIMGSDMESLPLIHNLLLVEEYQERYHAYIEQLTDYLEAVPERAGELGDLIRPYVEADPTKFCTMEQFENCLVYSETDEADQGGGAMAPPELDGQASPQQPGGELENGGQMPPAGINPFGGQPPQMNGGPDGFAPENLTEGEWEQRKEQFGGGQKGGFGGGMMMQGTASIVNYAVDRAANIRKQLSGELPTAGTTGTGMGGGGRGNHGGPAERPGQDQIKVTVNGSQIKFDQQPIEENGTTLVPLRKIFEALGAHVEWDEETQTVTAVLDGTTLVLTVGSDTATVNGETKELSLPSRVVNDRTLVPVRFISENFGWTVNWEEETKTVGITK